MCSPDVEGQVLMRIVLKTIHEVCNDWSRETPHFSSPGNKVTYSVHSIKNTRRKMEDRYAVCTDFNALFKIKVSVCVCVFIYGV